MSLRRMLTYSDKYESVLKSQRFLKKSLALQIYKNIDKSTGQQLASLAKTQISAILDNALRSSKSSNSSDVCMSMAGIYFTDALTGFAFRNLFQTPIPPLSHLERKSKSVYI